MKIVWRVAQPAEVAALANSSVPEPRNLGRLRYYSREAIFIVVRRAGMPFLCDLRHSSGPYCNLPRLRRLPIRLCRSRATSAGCATTPEKRFLLSGAGQGCRFSVIYENRVESSATCRGCGACQFVCAGAAQPRQVALLLPRSDFYCRAPGRDAVSL